jgi:fructuronate reductase
MLHEAVPTLEGIDQAELQTYATRLLQRFANDSLQHQLHQIAMDGSQKLPQRWLDGCQILLDTEQPIDCTALGIAAWIRHIEQTQTQQGELNDPLAPRLLSLAQRHADNPAQLLAAFLAQDDIFAPALAANSHFQQALTRAWNALQQTPVPDLLKRMTAHSV